MTYSELRRLSPELPQNEKDTAICHFCSLDKGQLMAHLDEKPSKSAERQVLEAYRKLKKDAPIQYITGQCDFYGIEFLVDKNVLIPRFDTETLVDYCIKNLPEGICFADLCCGSGCIGLSILKNRPDLKCVLADISRPALHICQKNATRLGLNDRCNIIRADVTDTEMYKNLRGVSYIVSNPPYIKTLDIPSLDIHVLSEPYIALDGGADGLDFYRNISASCVNFFGKRTHIIFEIGYDEAIGLLKIAKSHGMLCEIVKDINGNDRVAILHYR